MAFGGQLKSGDSYLRERKSDGAEIFTIKDERHARHWMARAFPVLLVIRNAKGEVRWMEVRDRLKRASETTAIPHNSHPAGGHLLPPPWAKGRKSSSRASGST